MTSSLIELASDVVIPIATFVLGFFVSRFTLSKSERLTHQQRQYENTRQLEEQRKAAYDRFTTALKSYVAGESPADVTTFYEIATSGDAYFNALKSAATAIQAKAIDPSARDGTYIPAIVEALEKSVPAYYQNLQKIAEKMDHRYDGQFKEQNYRSMIEVAKKFGALTDYDVHALTKATTKKMVETD